MPQQYQPIPEQSPRQVQQQQMGPQMQSKTPPQLPDHAMLIALSIAALGKQLGDLAQLEKDAAKRDAMLAEGAEIVQRAMNIVHHDKLYITVPPGWEPPNMLEPCPSCPHMRSKGQRP